MNPIQKSCREAVYVKGASTSLRLTVEEAAVSVPLRVMANVAFAGDVDGSDLQATSRRRGLEPRLQASVGQGYQAEQRSA